MPRFAYFCGHEQFQPEVLLDHAVLAESVGFDALKYAWARRPEDLIDIYRPLVEVGADIVTLQVTSVDQPKTIEALGRLVLPALRALGGRS